MDPNLENNDLNQGGQPNTPTLPRNPYARTGSSINRPTISSTPSPSQPPVISSQSAAQQSPQPQPQQPTFSQPIAPVGGDVVLQTSPQGAKKKIIIIPIIVIIIVLVCILAFIFLPKTSTPVINNFNKYANFLLYEKDSMDDIPNYDEEEEYSIFNMIAECEDEDSENCFSNASKLRALFDDFFNLFNEDNAVISEYRSIVDFVYTYMTSQDFSESELISLSRKNSQEAISKINEHFSDFDGIDLDEAKEYATNRTETYANIIKLYQIYDRVGCVKDNSIDDACLESVIYSDEDFNNSSVLVDEIEEQDAEAQNIQDEVFEKIVKQCWDVKNEL